jgi:hypothetical protein
MHGEYNVKSGLLYFLMSWGSVFREKLIPYVPKKFVAENNRTAFGVAEGESLLVPGLNGDYRDAGFAFAQFV